MNNEQENTTLPEEVLVQKIYFIRGQKIMLDKDFALLYDIETKYLKRAVRRNIERFPEDFMFELNDEELENLRCQFGTSNWGGNRYRPMVFTEHGVLMLSSVLNCKRAIKVNIQIMRIFTKLREMLSTHKEILQKIEELERNHKDHDEKINLIFEYIKQLEQTKQEDLEYKIRPKIGFSRNMNN